MKKKTKYISQYRPKTRSRHPSHEPLRSQLPLLGFKSVVRLGSTTDVPDTVTNGGNRIECNTIEAINNSASKFLMKQCFTKAGIITAPWYIATTKNQNNSLVFVDMNKDDSYSIENLIYPLIVKHVHGSRGTGNCKINSPEALKTCIEGKDMSKYIIEQYKNYTREYRLHVTEEGCFYACRKMLKNDCPKEKRWFRNDSNSVWILEENQMFDKPINWDKIVDESTKALKAVELDFSAMDVKVQSRLDKDGNIRENPEFIIIECNSAPSLGEITLQKYLIEIPKILNRKYENYLK